eukprot:GGOE01020843.1.p2 GENE.GGOE01020843.1~~GGOE01020843.1.p2  ORF type:complete len:284 (-),score=72.25 GGOE01020843.1:73-924(-)
MPQPSNLFQPSCSSCIDDAVTFFSDIANEKDVQYQCSDEVIIAITQDPHIQNSSGGIVWETAYLMAMYFEQCILPKCQTSPPTVLEVGAGCGLLGLVLAHYGCRVVLTDQPSTVPSLCRNAIANEVATANRAAVLPLFWGSKEDIEAVATKGPFDIVVGTDVFFSPALVEPLLATIHKLTTPLSTVYLCMQERCPDSHRQFLKQAPKYFVVEDDTPLVRRLPGCRFATELECFLFRLSGRKQLDGESLSHTVAPANSEAPDRAKKKKKKKRKRTNSETTHVCV